VHTWSVEGVTVNEAARSACGVFVTENPKWAKSKGFQIVLISTKKPVNWRVGNMNECGVSGVREYRPLHFQVFLESSRRACTRRCSFSVANWSIGAKFAWARSGVMGGTE
jgi:hypothetical protein